MPFSLDTFNTLISSHICKINPNSVLDVGVGSGKYGNIIKSILPSANVEGIEPTQKYIDEYKLNEVYNNIHCTTIQEFAKNNPRNRYNAVIFGDVLEHFFRSEAIDYIDYFLYRSDWVFALWPTFMPQDDAMDNSYEIHKSNFNLIDLSTKFDIHHYEKKFGWYHWNNPEFTHCEYNYCLMKGYVTHRNSGL
jgi:hypothetical protein